MAYSSAEKEFYQRHYQGALKINNSANLSEIEKTFFSPGKRYHIVCSELNVQKQYGTAVEIGCSDGDCMVYLGSRFKFKKLIGIDIAFPDDMHQEIGGVNYIQANSNDPLPLDDASVDVYVAMMVIEHLFDPFQSFAEIKRILSPSGQAFVNLPLVTSLKNRYRLMTGRLPITSVPFKRWLVDREWDGNHLHYFSMDAIQQLAKLSGLRVARASGVGRFHQLKTLAPSWLASEVSFSLTHA